MKRKKIHLHRNDFLGRGGFLRSECGLYFTSAHPRIIPIFAYPFFDYNTICLKCRYIMRYNIDEYFYLTYDHSKYRFLRSEEDYGDGLTTIYKLKNTSFYLNLSRRGIHRKNVGLSGGAT